jgi:signal transduction histidine kinase
MKHQEGPAAIWGDRNRLAALYRAGILDTPPEAEFDNLARLAVIACGTEWAAVNLIDDTRQWSKAMIGPGHREVPIAQSFCAWALLHPGVSIVPDVPREPALRDRMPASGEPTPHFYAAAPIRTDQGYAVGTVSVSDPAPRGSGLTPMQTEALMLLAQQATALLRAREAALYKQAFHQAPVDMVLIDVLDDDTFILADLNLTHARNTGLDPAQFIGATPEQVLLPGTAAFARAKYVECVRSGTVVHYEQSGVFPSGERLRHSFLVPLRDASGRIVRILLTSIDLTEFHRMQARLGQAQKMELLGQLTGGLAHDFNNVLTVVLGNLELASPAITDPSARRRVELARDAAVRGSLLIKQLLTFGRQEPLDPRPVHPNAVIHGMRDLLQRSLGGQVQVETALYPELWLAIAEPTRLEQAILNLAINARDAMPDGGHLLIETRNLPAGHPDEPDELPAGDFVGIAVVDDGVGMPQSVVERAMEPFFTTKPVGKGSGLGLAQVYRFARDVGGAMRIMSVERAGTRVELFLPRALPAGAVGAD